MYNTTTAFRELMAQPSRQLTARGVITFSDATTQNITAAEISKIQITEDAGAHLPLGGVSASSLTLNLDNRQGQWNSGGSILGSRTLDGATVKLEIGVLGAAYEYANLGFYALEDAIGQEQEPVIVLKGADYLANKAGREFNDTQTYPRTLGQILAFACAQAGIALKTTAFVSSTVSIPTKPNWEEGTTCRGVIGYVACCAAGFARMDRNGKLELVPFEHTPDYQVGPSRYINLEKQGAIFGPFNALSVYPYDAPHGYGATRIAADMSLVDNELNSIAVQGNPLLAYGSSVFDTLITNIQTALNGLTFHGGSIAWQGDPTLTAGDIAQVTDLKGGVVPLLILRQTITLDSGFSMQSGNKLNTAIKGQAKQEFVRVFTPTGKLNGTAIEGDINIRAGEQLNLLAGGKIVMEAPDGIVMSSGKGLDTALGEKAAQGDVTNLTARVSTAEQKITPDAITATVRNHANYKSDLAGKNRTYLMGTPPSGAITGDLWVDTANGNILKRWSGSSWVAVQDGAISIAQQTANKIAWLIASGDSASNMVLTEQLYELVTQRVMITANQQIDIKVANIQVGGRNMLKNSRNITMTPNGEGLGTTVLMGDGPEPYQRTVGNPSISTYGPDNAYDASCFVIPMVVGETYTVSVDVMSVGATRSVGFYNSQGMTEVVADKWTRISYTYEYTSNKRVLGLTGPGNIYVYSKNWQIEIGNKASNWSPAPEDIEGRMSSAELQLTNDSIMQKVATHTTYTQRQTAIDNATSAAQNTANSRNRTYQSTTSPTNPVVGDLWINPNANSEVRRWDGSSWILSQDTRIASTANTVSTTLNSTGVYNLVKQNTEYINAMGDKASVQSVSTLNTTVGNIQGAVETIQGGVTNKSMLEMADDRAALKVSEIRWGGGNILINALFEYDVPLTGWNANQAVTLAQYSTTWFPRGYLYMECNQSTSSPGLITYDNVMWDRLVTGKSYVLTVQLASVDANPPTLSVGIGNQAIGTFGAGTKSIKFTYSNTGSNYLLLHWGGNGTPPATGSKIGVIYMTLVEGNMAPSGFVSSPRDAANSLKASGIEILANLLRLYSSGKLMADGSEIDFNTALFNLHDGDKEILSATPGGVAIGAEYVYANRYLGPIVQTYPGGNVPWQGSFAATLAGIPKYLLADTIINVPAGTYNETIYINGFVGAALGVYIASNVTIHGGIYIRDCSRVTIIGPSDMSAIINVPTLLQGIYINSVSNLWISNLRVTGRIRGSSSDSTGYGMLIYATSGIVRDCIVERAQYGIGCYYGCAMVCYNNRGGVVGSSDYTTLANLIQGILADSGSHIGIGGMIPAAPTATATNMATIVGTGTQTGSPGTAPAPPSTVVRTYAQAQSARLRTPKDNSAYLGFNTTNMPTQGEYTVSGVAYAYFGIWVLPAITSASTASAAKLTIKRHTEGGSSAAVNVHLHYFTDANIMGASYTAQSARAKFTSTGLSASMARGGTYTFILPSAVINAIKNGTLKGFGVVDRSANSAYPYAPMSADITLEVTTAS
ncbi:MAG: hypothetical protein ACOX63_10030 [Christensenellales bacterium]|jgi:hypothetical protein